VEARSGHGSAEGGERRQPTRAKLCHAGAKRAFPRNTDKADATTNKKGADFSSAFSS